MTRRPAMIFHMPFALGERAGSASGIRPVKMRRAFESVGYEVIEVSGRHAERRRRIAEVKRRISGGLAVDFVYSESMTVPTGFGEPITPATSVTRDLGFLRFCRESGIEAGEVEELACRLLDDPSLLAAARRRAENVRELHTWSSRAEQVVSDLATRSDRQRAETT